jgi:predicted phosphoadenosine phosphosulfate sulfurtransferase
MLNEYVFQAPQNCDFIYRAQIPNFSHEFLTEEFKKDLKLPMETFSATGVRAQDSLNRRMAVFKYGPINNTNHNFMPIWNYSKKDCFKIISESGCKLPVDYDLFGRSFDGINYQFLKPLKEKYPQDYQKILDLFPLAELELKRIEFYKKHKAGTK